MITLLSVPVKHLHVSFHWFLPQYTHEACRCQGKILVYLLNLSKSIPTKNEQGSPSQGLPPPYDADFSSIAGSIWQDLHCRITISAPAVH